MVDFLQTPKWKCIFTDMFSMFCGFNLVQSPKKFIGTGAMRLQQYGKVIRDNRGRLTVAEELEECSMDPWLNMRSDLIKILEK